MGINDKLAAKLGRDPTDEELAFFKKSRDEKKAKKKLGADGIRNGTPVTTPKGLPESIAELTVDDGAEGAEREGTSAPAAAHLRVGDLGCCASVHICRSTPC